MGDHLCRAPRAECQCSSLVKRLPVFAKLYANRRSVSPPPEIIDEFDDYYGQQMYAHHGHTPPLTDADMANLSTFPPVGVPTVQIAVALAEKGPMMGARDENG